MFNLILLNGFHIILSSHFVMHHSLPNAHTCQIKLYGVSASRLPLDQAKYSCMLCYGLSHLPAFFFFCPDEYILPSGSPVFITLSCQSLSQEFCAVVLWLTGRGGYIMNSWGALIWRLRLLGYKRTFISMMQISLGLGHCTPGHVAHQWSFLFWSQPRTQVSVYS